MRLRVWCVWVIVCLLAVPAAAQDPVYDEVGSQYGRGYFAPFPWERVDVVTGNVFLSYTDLSLPGNGGLGLSVVRTYNSLDGKWRIGLAGIPLHVVFNGSVSDVDFVTADGAKHNAAGSGATTLTQGFWRFTKATRTLEMPNGLVLTYGHEPNSAGAYLTEIRDPFNNTITLSWNPAGAHLQSVTQHLGSQTRTITFANWQDDRATGMSFGGQSWNYVWQPLGNPAVNVITGVDTPGGSTWRFSYITDQQGALKLRTVTTPHGGTVTYNWGPQAFPTTPSQRIVVQSRVTGGRDVTGGTWTFNWQDTGRLLEIIGPASVVLYHTQVVNDIPVRTYRAVRGQGSILLDEETLTYETLPHPVAPMPAVKTVTQVRDGHTFTTTYTYSTDQTHWSNYGQPTQIVEQGSPTSAGPATRTTAITYAHAFSPYLRGRIASVATTVNGHTETRSFTYNNANGFMTSATALGRTTTFAPDTRGNVVAVTEAGGRVTNLTYDYGVVNSISSPASAVAVSRGINANGTVAWESSTGTAQTNYGYDGAGRLTSVSWPAGGRTGITTAYTMSNFQWVSTTETRGSVWVRTHLDGFGRPRLVEDSKGVKSRTTYNAAGQVVAQSAAFGGSVAEAATTFTYDGLGRILGSTAPDGGWREWYYAASSVRESEGLSSSTWRGTWRHFHWFKPGDGTMWRFIDPIQGDWRYEYNGRGQLVHVWQAGSQTVQSRGWSYNTHGELVTATDTESGTTTYQYNGAGLMNYSQDARGAALSGTTYTYNGDHQLTSVNAPGAADDVTITYDAAGRQKTVASPAVQTTYAYDTFSRVTARTDVIAGHTFSQTFTYDALDNLVRIDYPQSGRKVYYDYNTQQRLTSVRTQIATGPITTLATSFVYGGDGAVAAYTLGNGRTVSVQRDAQKRPTRWIDGPLDLTYTYDWAGNVKSLKDARDPGFSGTYSSQFSYDLVDRLTQVIGFGATTFAYSEGGDRTKQGSINFNYDANRRLASLSGGASGSFTYTPNGSLLTDPTGASYTYTSQNQLKTSKLGGQTTSYQYGGDGMRAIKTGPDSVPTISVYGVGGGPIGEYRVVGGAVQIVREYVYLGSQLLTSFAPSVVAPPPLSVAIQTPAATSTVTRGQNVSLTATASVGPGLTVSRVEYYTNGLLTGQATSGSYAVTLYTNYLPATSRIVARVVASNGQAVASAPVTLNVQ